MVDSFGATTVFTDDLPVTVWVVGRLSFETESGVEVEVEAGAGAGEETSEGDDTESVMEAGARLRSKDAVGAED